MLMFVPDLLVLSHFIHAKINPVSVFSTFLYWRSIAAYFSVKFRKYTAKNKWKCFPPFKDTIFVHPFNVITMLHFGKFLVSRIVPSGWEGQNSRSFSVAVFEKLVEENQRLFYYSAYLPNFSISPNNTQSHTQECSLPHCFVLPWSALLYYSFLLIKRKLICPLDSKEPKEDEDVLHSND